jgi:hypothetical protein
MYNTGGVGEGEPVMCLRQKIKYTVYIYTVYVNILWGRERTLYTYFVDREPEGREY